MLECESVCSLVFMTDRGTGPGGEAHSGQRARPCNSSNFSVDSEKLPSCLIPQHTGQYYDGVSEITLLVRGDAGNGLASCSRTKINFTVLESPISSINIKSTHENLKTIFLLDAHIFLFFSLPF